METIKDFFTDKYGQNYLVTVKIWSQVDNILEFKIESLRCVTFSNGILESSPYLDITLFPDIHSKILEKYMILLKKSLNPDKIIYSPHSYSEVL